MSSTQATSGRLVSLIHPRAQDIDLSDISVSLERQVRFNGHGRRPYSVAEHSMHVADLLPPSLKLAGLLHDAHETYMGDITTPVKRAGVSGTADIAAVLDRAIEEAFDLPLGYLSNRLIKAADEAALCIEAQELFGIEATKKWDGLSDRFHNSVLSLRDIGIETQQLERVRLSIRAGMYMPGMFFEAVNLITGR